MITIVTGQARTGTSLTMMVLDRGGIPALYDPDINKNLNPFGSFESRSLITSAAQLEGKCYKCLAPQNLFDLPKGNYKVIMPVRDPEQIMLSRFEVFKGKELPKNIPAQKAAIDKQYRFMRFIVNHRKDMELLEVNYDDYFSKPDETIDAIANFVGVTFDKVKAKEAIAPEIYKKRDFETIKKKVELVWQPKN